MKPLITVAPVRSPEPPVVRKPLTRAEFGQLMMDQLGKCGCGCGEKLQPMTEGVIDEHVISLGAGGTNDLANRSLFRKPCATAKTVGDKGTIGKVKRIEARENGTRRERRPIPQAANPWPPKGSTKIASRPSAKSLRLAGSCSADAVGMKAEGRNEPKTTKSGAS
jgi:hypothetical protein